MRPSDFSSSPSYYFQFKVTTKVVNSESSYCIREVEFPVRVHGITMDFVSTIWVTVGTFAAGLFISLSVMGVMYYKEQHPKAPPGNEMDAMFGMQ